MKAKLRTGGNEDDISPKDAVKMLIGFTIGLNVYSIFMLFYNIITYEDISFIHIFGLIGINIGMYYIIRRIYRYSKSDEGLQN